MINNRRIKDCFLFFNELDLLEIRLNILNEVVDEFILIESNLTFQNQSKPLFYKDNKQRFQKFNHKITSYSLENLSFENFSYWEVEWYQRNFISETLKNSYDNDVIFVSDLDEIWNPIKIKKYIETIDDNQVYKWGSKLCYFYFNLMADKKEWYQPFFLSYSLLKNKNLSQTTINDITQNKKSEFSTYEKIHDCGWHFSYLEDPEYKLKSFSHSEHRDKKNEYLKDCVKKLINPFHGNEMEVISENDFGSYLPKYLLDNLDKYKKWVI